MNEVITVNTDRNRQAYLLHNQIMASGALVSQYLLSMCKDLKMMRDEKLYTELGYKDFGEYCDKAVGIGARQGYTYIQSLEKLGANVIEENSHLGITKLSLLAQMNPVDRIQAIESGELENMSTRDVKELVEKSNAQSEQLSLLTEERDGLQSENEDLEELVHKLKTENEELKNKPTEISPEPSAEKIAEIRAEIEAELKDKHAAEMESAVKAAKAEEKEKTAKKIQKAKEEGIKEADSKKEQEIADAVKKAKEEAKAESKELEETVANLKAETAELEKRLKASDSETQKFLIYMQSFQEYLNKALSTLNGLEKEQKEKRQKAVKTVLNDILSKIGG